MEVLAHYWPHAIGLIVLSVCSVLIKRYALKIVNVIENAVTHEQLEAAMKESDKKIQGVEGRIEKRMESAIDRLKDDMRARDRDFSQQINDGFRSVHERIDGIFKRPTGGR